MGSCGWCICDLTMDGPPGFMRQEASNWGDWQFQYCTSLQSAISLEGGAYQHFYVNSILFEAPLVNDFSSLYVSVEDLVSPIGGHHVHPPFPVHEECLVGGEGAALGRSDHEAHSRVLHIHEL